MIKLENISKKTFNRTTGDLETQETVEFVCEGCRHLVNEGDSFCWNCGTTLSILSATEHYVLGEKLEDKEFKKVKSKHGNDLMTFVQGIVESKKVEKIKV